MKSIKLKSFLIAVLAFVMVAALGSYFGMGLSALARRNVTVSGASIFSVAGDAEVWAHRVENIDDEDDPYYYTMFAFSGKSDAVNYKRNLAYKWFANSNDFNDYLEEPYEGLNGNWWIRDIDTKIAYDAEVSYEIGENGTWVIGETDTEVSANLLPTRKIGYFNMEIGFEEINFEKFVITFETQQFYMTKAEKTTNYVVFVPNSTNDKVYAVITDDKEVVEADEIPTEGCVALDIDHIIIELTENDDTADGQFGVNVYNAGNKSEKVQEGVFNNVGKTYAKNVTSTTKPVVPLSFKAVMPEEEEATAVKQWARMALYSLNGQSFVLNRNDKGETVNTSRDINTVDDGGGKVHYTGGQVNDTQPPVLCLDKNVSYVKEGQEISFSYTAVDVLVQSPGVETGYFLLTYDQAKDGNFKADDIFADNLYRVVKDSDDQYIYPHANHYLPEAKDYKAGSKLGEELNPVAAIKVYLKLTDTTSSGGQSTYVLLDWYVADEYKIEVNGHDYIAVAEDKSGATYKNYDGTNDEEWQKLVAEYQEEVTKAAKDIRAGADDFYLPSLEKLLSDNATAYADMTFSIYYLANGNQTVNSNKTASQLSIDLNVQGTYKFTVYAFDALSNNMYYLNDKGEKVEFSTNDIWNIYDNEDGDYPENLLPWFTFEAGIADLSVQDPGEQSTAYVGKTYTVNRTDFEIEGISTSESYSLYLFNSKLYHEETGTALTYKQFMELKQSMFEDAETRKYFTTITPLAELDADSEEYEMFSEYKWNVSSRSFVPQDENGFYLIKCTVTSTQFPTQEAVSAYMGIAASAIPSEREGENTWLADNMASIILLSIAGAAAIGIVIVLFIKPNDDKDIDVQFEESKKKK